MTHGVLTDWTEPARPGGSAPRRLAASAGGLTVSAALYGLSFGLWRAPEQALLAAAKFPLALLAVTALTAGVNALIAQALDADLTRRQVLQFHLAVFGTAAVLLAAFAPVFVFLACTLPAPGEPGDRAVYAGLLTLHTGAVGLAGCAGYVRAARALARHGLSRTLRRRILAAWIVVSGFTGSEVCWICTPLLARPDLPIVALNPNAFRMTMYEYLWRQWLPPATRHLSF